MKRPILLTPSRLVFAAVLASLSTAHAHHAEAMSGKPFLQGLSMPLHGLDHLLYGFGFRCFSPFYYSPEVA